MGTTDIMLKPFALKIVRIALINAVSKGVILTLTLEADGVFNCMYRVTWTTLSKS